ncbi:nitrogen regulation protein NR(II) [Pararcticibacter amylolyticus]|uniref:PAS domain-containing protein n=1 Tax=Pararcticibacter amylolyticus TaxID=2173175 RepID=A0A2U2PFH0_9SPHI|nr:hypothetical protein [Pararcticibacter amylolyticus]PWG80110.1 hypothetical protein DDR33_12970 [Pararcticibacter amylolyticus]
MSEGDEIIDFKQLYHQSPCGLVSYALKGGRILHANKTLLGWLDVTEHEIRGIHFTELLDRGGRLYYQLFVYPLLRVEQEAKEISFQIITEKTGFACLFSARACLHPGMQDPIVHATIYKVEDRKKYEAELLKRKTLAEEERQKKEDALDEVAFYQSHLVRAPLANILGLVEILEHGRNDQDIRSIIALLKESTGQLDNVIKKIVNKART